MRIFETWASKFTEKYARAVAENERKKYSLELEGKHLQTDLKNCHTSEKYLDCKSKLDEIYFEKADGVRIRSKYDLYKSGEKSNTFFFNLEKIREVYFVHLLKIKRKLATKLKQILNSNTFIKSS